ncbi:uncharacterized protein CC84DRAFT_597718 [Paraphaeosphaeria sporulosa]|uniref:Uncharacterized protein n=1 Tax=Paraphaeosphaeria sporulosa TaxID=1460663 RepID=A0A177CQA0_9PLEO|nr:uncharacterized protein CC84DRAFT_597718 [Paraphaeosphaeria sporulosa]OAG08927.1 hypothetical protein CC84DRAFT_597718 [Paraphaeosphaeria sporulosa]
MLAMHSFTLTPTLLPLQRNHAHVDPQSFKPCHLSIAIRVSPDDPGHDIGRASRCTSTGGHIKLHALPIGLDAGTPLRSHVAPLLISNTAIKLTSINPHNLSTCWPRRTLRFYGLPRSNGSMPCEATQVFPRRPSRRKRAAQARARASPTGK